MFALVGFVRWLSLGDWLVMIISLCNIDFILRFVVYNYYFDCFNGSSSLG